MSAEIKKKKQVRDPPKVGEIFESNKCGDVLVTNYNNAYEVSILFLDTGNKAIVRSCSLRKGEVKDKMNPSVCGVGYLGIGEFNTTHRTYQAWKSMIERCYCSKFHELQPKYKDCTVCDEWHNYQNFAKWFEENYPKDGNGYNLDKDIKIRGNRIYSPYTCLFVSRTENSVHANARYFNFISPAGELVEIYNLLEFCRNHGLSPSCMYQVALGKYRQHKGWIVVSEGGGLK